MSTEDLDAEGSEAPITSGRVLGRYVLCYELASGGMATVYLARTEGSSGFDRLVALKIIHPHLAKQREFVDMFLDEAKIAARIVHPNVCSVFDFGQEEGTYYLAMDYLVGETMGRLMRAAWKKPGVVQRKNTFPIFARVIAEAAEGLHAAHESRGDDGQLLGVVHRDVTPQNLFVGYDGSLRVVDFGVALAVGRSHHTAVGTLKGKYPYMSPEQVTQKNVDRRSDVWGLGVCLWEMLAGKRLFRQTSEFETLKAVTEARLPRPSEINPAVPASLDAIVQRALTRDRELRYPTARDMSKDLSAAISALGGATAGDVAELMDELFATERKERAALMERARKLDPEHPSTSKVKPAPIRGGFGAPEPVSTAAPLPTAALGAGAVVPPFVPLPALDPGRNDPSLPIVLEEPSTASSRALVLGAVGLALVLVIVGGIFLMLRGEGEDTPSTPLAIAALPDVPLLEDAGMPDAGLADAGAPDGGRAASSERRRDRDAGTRRRGGDVVAPAGGNGRLSVVTPPGWAEIFVEGRRVGRSPTELTLPAGRHSVRIVPYGDGTPIERTVVVEPDGSARLVVRLAAP